MQPIHLAIGIGEGIITAGVLCFIHSARPEILEYEVSGKKLGLSISLKKVTITMVVLAALVGGVLSLYASSYPDGLEWSMGNIIGEKELQTEGKAYKKAENIQETTSFMPDYNFKNANEDSSIGTSAAGIVGGAITLIFAFLIGFIVAMITSIITLLLTSGMFPTVVIPLISTCFFETGCAAIIGNAKGGVRGCIIGAAACGIVMVFLVGFGAYFFNNTIQQWMLVYGGQDFSLWGIVEGFIARLIA